MNIEKNTEKNTEKFTENFTEKNTEKFFCIFFRIFFCIFFCIFIHGRSYCQNMECGPLVEVSLISKFRVDNHSYGKSADAMFGGATP